MDSARVRTGTGTAVPVFFKIWN
eukprot:SAG31_NODE_37951_length_300_cov_0.766169_1_plen_22_part_01